MVLTNSWDDVNRGFCLLWSRLKLVSFDSLDELSVSEIVSMGQIEGSFRARARGVFARACPLLAIMPDNWIYII